MNDSESVAVLTTEERAWIFKDALGEGADIHFDLNRTDPLNLFLSNLSISGCKMAVLDENHFYSVDILAQGLMEYLNDPTHAYNRMRIVMVCADRKPGDAFLAFVAEYCDIYDVVYNTKVPSIAASLERMIRYPSKRTDILELLASSPRDIKLAAPRDERTVNLHIDVSIEGYGKARDLGTFVV